MQLEPDLASAGLARRRLLDVCGRVTTDEERCDSLALIVTELVSNAIRHGGPPVSLDYAVTDGAVRVEVGDGSHEPPHVEDCDGSLEPGGRGLALVAALSRRWGWQDTPDGKRVWCEV